ncbi:MAG: hypothetical protein AB1531_09815 [Chloroflexota bacterium]
MKKRGHHSLADRLTAWLTHRHLPFFTAIIGILLGIPAFWTGGGPSDDILQRSAILSSPLSTVLTRLYVFLDPAVNHQSMDAGYFPWWTYEPAKVIFFRPIAAFSLWLDHQLWPNSHYLMLIHSILLYGVLCLIAAFLFRRLMGVTLQAGLAAILFALSTAHIGAVVSLAARNLILMSIFGFLALTLHDRWRRDGWRPGVFLALVCLALSLLSAETGVATSTYLLAYVLFFDGRPWRERSLSFLPYLGVILVWLAVYQVSGYGAAGSGFYLSPWHEPFRFGIAILERAPFLLMGQWILPDPVVYTVLSNGARILLWILSVFILIFIGVLLKPLIKSDRTARFWTLGMLLSVIPVCAVSPASGRHLMFISLGAFGLMGQFIAGRLFSFDWTPSRKAWRTAAMVMSVLFLGLHVMVYPVAGSLVRLQVDNYAIAVTDIGQQPDMESKDFIIVNAPSPSLFLYFPAFREFTRQPLPAHLRILAPGFSSVSLTTVDERTLVIQPETGFLYSPEYLDLDGTAFFPLFHSSYSFQYGDGLFRGQDYPMELGQQVDLSGISIEVISLTEDERPQAVRVTFDWPLEDESLVWLMWDWENARYIPFLLPDIGDTLLIPGPY